MIVDTPGFLIFQTVPPILTHIHVTQRILPLTWDLLIEVSGLERFLREQIRPRSGFIELNIPNKPSRLGKNLRQV